RRESGEGDFPRLGHNQPERRAVRPTDGTHVGDPYQSTSLPTPRGEMESVPLESEGHRTTGQDHGRPLPPREGRVDGVHQPAWVEKSHQRSEPPSRLRGIEYRRVDLQEPLLRTAPSRNGHDARTGRRLGCPDPLHLADTGHLSTFRTEADDRSIDLSSPD